MDALEEYFARVYVVNLDRRPDRLETFARNFRAPAWPFRTPERYRAIDGKKAPFPSWWGVGPGAWGVYRSHLRIVEQCINEDVRSVLILEDDAVLCDGFAEKAKAYIEALPGDAQLIYLGGQHLFQESQPPRKINDHVVRPFNVNRLHAFGLTRAGMGTFYQHICANAWRPQHHIDHHVGQLLQRRGIVAYAPSEWLIGQGEGKSDICNRDLEVRFFDGKTKEAPKPNMKAIPTVIVVLGPYRSGTSCIAGSLHHLGISMGERFFGANVRAAPKGCYEAQVLHRICSQIYPEPFFVTNKPHEFRTGLLQHWAGNLKTGPIVGAKNPRLCLMVPEMLEAWPGCKFIRVERPLAESIQSLHKLGWWKSHQDPETLLKRLVATRDASLEGVAEDRIMTVEYAEFLQDTRTHLERIARWAGYQASEEQYRQAVAFVDPALRHEVVA